MSGLAAKSEKRVCRVCAEEKSLSVEFFSSVQRNGKSWFSGRCRSCDAAATRERWRLDPDAKAKDRKRRDTNREAIRERDRLRARRDRVKKRAQINRWIAANQERNAEICRAATQRWRDRNPDKATAGSRRRAEMVRRAEGTFTQADIKRITIAQKGKCAICRRKKELTIDHIKPLSKGGTNWPRNIQMLCRPCNSSKQAADPIEYMQKRGALL